MGLTKDYQRFLPAGSCNIVGSANGCIQAIDKVSCAVSACETVIIYNMRTLEKTAHVRRDNVEVSVFRYSDDRKRLAVGYADGEVHLYTCAKRGYDGPVMFAGHRTGINSLAFSHDGLTLAVGGKDSAIVLFDLLAETSLFRLNGHKSSVTQLQFTRDDKYLISSSKDMHVKFWDIGSQSCFYTLVECTSEVYSFALLKNDEMLVVGTANIEIEVFALRWLQSHEHVDLANDEDLLAKKLTLEDVGSLGAAQGNEIMTCSSIGSVTRQSKGRTLQLATSSDEAVVCCLGSDNLVDVLRIYTSQESQKRLRKKLHRYKKTANEDSDDEQATEAEISRDISLVISRIGGVELSSKVKWIDLYAQVIIKDNIKQYRMYSLLKSNTVEGTLLNLDTKANLVKSETVVNLNYRGHRNDVRALSMSSNDATVLSCAGDSAIVWDMRSLLPLNHFANDSVRNIVSCMFLEGDKQFIVGTKQGAVHCFNVPTATLMWSDLAAHSNSITRFLHFRNKTEYLTCSADKNVHYWSYKWQQDEDGRHIVTERTNSIELPDEGICAALSPNQRLLAVGLLDNTARVFHAEKRTTLLTLYGHSLPVMCVDIAPDNKIVATGSADKTVKIWGLDFGDCHRSLFAHDDVVTCLKFNVDLDEQLVWSAGKDGKIKQWNARKFDQIQVLKGHLAEVRAAVATFDGRTLVSAASDRSIRLWEESEELVVVNEEEEAAREKEDFDKIIDAEDIVPGEATEGAEVGMAAKKSVSTVKGAEAILEALQVYRVESAELIDDPNRKTHDLVLAYESASLHQFVLDVIARVNSAHLERSLLLVPFDYTIDILTCIDKCAQESYKFELGARVAIFLLKVNMNQLISQRDLLPLIKRLHHSLPAQVNKAATRVNFNLAALKLHKLTIEERDEVRLFANKPKVKTKRSKHVKRARDRAIVNPVKT